MYCRLFYGLATLDAAGCMCRFTAENVRNGLHHTHIRVSFWSAHSALSVSSEICQPTNHSRCGVVT